jgi:hypothetical protein
MQVTVGQVKISTLRIRQKSTVWFVTSKPVLIKNFLLGLETRLSSRQFLKAIKKLTIPLTGTRWPKVLGGLPVKTVEHVTFSAAAVTGSSMGTWTLL